MDERLQNREAEENILGSLMVDPSIAPPIITQVIDILGVNPSIFFTQDHQLIYKAILDVHAKSIISSTLAVAYQLKATDDIKRAGGASRLHELQSVIVETENTPYYCEIVKELYLRRLYRHNLASQLEMVDDLDTSLPSVIAATSENASTIERKLTIRGTPTIAADVIQQTEYKETPDLVPGLFRQGVILLTGQPKVGKSYAMLNLAIAACHGPGGKVWGYFEMGEKVNTLYIAMESSYNEIKERMKQLSPGSIPPSNLHFMEIEAGYDFRLDEEGLSSLRKTVQSLDIGLVIVDTWQRACPIIEGKGNAFQNEHKYLQDVYNWAKILGISLIIVHHTRKSKDEFSPMNEISGSMAFQAVPDTLALIRNVEDTQKNVLIHARGMQELEFGIEVDVRKPGVVSYEELNESNSMQSQRTSDLILSAFTNTVEQLSPAVIAERIERKPNSIVASLKRLAEKGAVEKVGHGKYRLPESAEGVDFG